MFTCTYLSACTGKFMIQGVKINTPLYLAKIEGVTKGTSTYTIIVSQLESLSTIHYTLKVGILKQPLGISCLCYQLN